MASKPPQYGSSLQGPTSYHIWQQQTLQQQAIPIPPINPPGSPNLVVPDPPTPPPTSTKKQQLTRLFAVLITFTLALALYFVWHTSSPTAATPSVVTQQSFGSTSSTTTTSSGTIQVYAVGAVKHPGVYTLEAGARLFQLLQAAGGPQANANLVALNLAAKLSDGQEIYVTMIGETPPTYAGGVPGPGTDGGTPGATGQLVNINTASADELRQQLHISSTTAQNIVNYRLQHGNYSNVDQLLQVVSRSMYDKIRGLVTVS